MIGSARKIEPNAGIVLIGYRGTGKSTIGQLVANRLGWDFEDADAVLERGLGRTIAQVFAQEGEGFFRELEESTLFELASRSRLVLGTGGGAVLRESNRRILRSFGFIAWLVASPETIVERLRRDPKGRPALTTAGLLDEVAEVLAAREPLYKELAHVVIETDDRSAEQVADRVLEGWNASVAHSLNHSTEVREQST